MATTFVAVTRLKIGPKDDVKYIEPGEVVKGLPAEEVKHLFKLGSITQKGSKDDPNRDKEDQEEEPELADEAQPAPPPDA
jgi:hypothetical protein